MALDDMATGFMELWDTLGAQIIVIHGENVKAVISAINHEDVIIVGGQIAKFNWQATVLKDEIASLFDEVKVGTFVYFNGKKLQIASISHTPGSPLCHFTMSEV